MSPAPLTREDAVNGVARRRRPFSLRPKRTASGEAGSRRGSIGHIPNPIIVQRRPSIMPSFFPTSLPRQSPLTPLEYYGPYAHSASALLLPSVGGSGYGPGELDSYGMEGDDPFGVVKPSAYHSTVSAMAAPYGKALDHPTAPNGAAHPKNRYGHIAPPVLPPLHVLDGPTDDGHPGYHAHPAGRPIVPAPPKEDKIAGGVAAQLDYEMEQMGDFVSEMAQGMYGLYQSRLCMADIDIARSVQPSTVVAPEFRKYVAQTLTSTRLPSSTILLGLHYLGVRMAKLSAQGIYPLNSHHIYSLLTTALMLGSKFLDDNTFQNRSWAEVSSIPVAELNAHELEWLRDIQWNLHFDATDPQGFHAWLQQWERYRAKHVAIAMNAIKLTPLDTSMRIHKQLPPPPIYPPSYSDFTMALKDRVPSHWPTPRHDAWPPPLRSATERSPPSAPETGPNTPEWYGCHGGVVGYGSIGPGYSLRLPSSARSPYHPHYAPHFAPAMWSGHGMGCICGYCLPHHDRYAMTYGYGAQSVVG